MSDDRPSWPGSVGAVVEDRLQARRERAHDVGEARALSAERQHACEFRAERLQGFCLLSRVQRDEAARAGIQLGPYRVDFALGF